MPTRGIIRAVARAGGGAGGESCEARCNARRRVAATPALPAAWWAALLCCALLLLLAGMPQARAQAAATAAPSPASTTVNPQARPGEVLHYTHAEMLYQAPGQAPPLANVVDESRLAGTWTRVELPYLARKAAPDARKPGAMSTTWFRVNVEEFAKTRVPTDFYLLRWIAAGQLAVYGDGHLLYRSVGSPMWNLFTHPQLLLRLSQTADNPPPRVLLIRLDSITTLDAALSSFYVGDSNTLIERAKARDWLAYQLPFMTSAAFLAVGLFSFGVWLFRRRYANLLIFFIALFSAVRRWHFAAGIEKLAIPDAWFIWLLLNALAWQLVATHLFMQFLHGRVQRRLSWTLAGIATLITLFTLPIGWLPLSLNVIMRLYVQGVIIALALLIASVGSWNTWRARSLDAGLLVGAFWLTMLGGIADYAKLLWLADVEGYYFTPYSAMVFALTCMLLMFRHYLSVLKEIETVNAGLEARLDKREQELAESYARLREVEYRQTLSEERARLTQDMHDGLGASLVSALRVVQSGRMNEAELSEVLKSCIEDLKLTIDSMEPVDADLLLLLATLRFRLGPRLESAGIRLRWEVMDVPQLDWLDPRNALHVLRILQEAFANVLKHTRANEIRVSTSAVDGWVTVCIADNGEGFDVQKVQAQVRAQVVGVVGMGGRGLMNQQRRAQAIGARVEIASDANGTRLSLRLPQVRAQQVQDGAQAGASAGAIGAGAA